MMTDLAADLGVPVLISGGVVSAPVAHIDMTLPADYELFELVLTGVTLSARAYTNFAFGFGGVVLSQSQSYFDGWNQGFGASIQSSDGQAFGVIRTYIDPGTEARHANLSGHSYISFDYQNFNFSGFQNGMNGYTIVGKVNENPELAIAPARANLVRFWAGARNPAQTAISIVGGSYKLYGVKA